jgi:hypothetical protein
VSRQGWRPRRSSGGEVDCGHHQFDERIRAGEANRDVLVVATALAVVPIGVMARVARFFVTVIVIVIGQRATAGSAMLVK